MARGLCFKWRDTIGRTPPEPAPAGVHYGLWLRLAPKRELTRNRFLYNWHWFRDYGHGDLGDQGIHEVDAARWGLGIKYPAKASAMGGHFMFDDDQETPNTLTTLYEFDEGTGRNSWCSKCGTGPPTHEAGIGEGGRRRDPNTIGNIFYGRKGYLEVDGYAKYYTFFGRERAPRPRRQEVGNNRANFIEVVRSRKVSGLNATQEDDGVSCTLVHLANMSYRLGRTLYFDAGKFQCVGDEEANRMFTRNYRRPFVVPKLA